MRQRSFFVKLFVGNLVLVGIIVAVSFTISYRYLNAEYSRRGEAHQRQLAEAFREVFESGWPWPPAEVDRRCKRMLQDRSARLTVIGADGQVLGDSDADPVSMENHKTRDRPEVLAALEGVPGMDVRRSETLGREFRYVARPLHGNGQVVGLVRLAMPVTAIAESRGFIRNALLWAALAAAGVAVVLAGLVSWIWYAPLRQITHTARKIAAGNLSQKARISGSDELADLAAALNEMRQGLSRQIDLIAAQREHLQTVVANLGEGVIALDGRRHVLLINDTAVEMLAHEATEPAGRHIQTVVRVPQVVEMLDELSGGQSVSRQIEVDLAGRRLHLDVHASEVASPQAEAISTILVVRDVTEIARTAAIKAEFVANASHELRTPLATIRAAVDSLMLMDSGDRDAFRKFTAILDRHVRRLENMTRDLLDLHLVEQAKGGLRLQDVPLASLGGWVKDHFAIGAAERDIRLEVVVEPPEQRLRSDRRLLQLILQNLVDNAVKFTPAGGRVECRLEALDGTVRLRVADTGCGMSPEVHHRVFERFFQADASRSGGDRRGTGLGLAIVKHAAERLGAKVALHSKPGQGTTIDVTVPLD